MTFLYYGDKKNSRLRSCEELYGLLSRNTCISNVKSYTKGKVYFYHPGFQHYVRLETDEIITLILQIFKLAGMPVPLITIKGIADLIRHNEAEYGHPTLDDDKYILLENGVLDLNTKQLLSKSESFFLTKSRGLFNWDPDCPTSVFQEFLDDFILHRG
uniref:Bacteriophage/plasmid primase P4 C-terminal domain-containing protein n=1 Tax=Anthoceros angustus TaxID=48387 RepID=A0A2P1L4V8_ANTAG|nr:hypothetical protein AnanMp19 [Anthoceros angustus]AVP12841.1 hypothetical protein AnanMp19 [Anthoceros angustus]